MQLTDAASCGDASKAGARHSSETMGHLNDAHGSLVKAGAVCKAAETEEEHQGTKFSASTTEGSAMSAEVTATKVATAADNAREEANGAILAATATTQPTGVEALLKILAGNDEDKATLAKTLGGITENLTKLSERVEEIAKQPMPARAASGATLPDGVIDVSKAEDGRSVDHMATAKSHMSQEEIAEILKGMSPEARAMLEVRAALRNPYTQQGR